MQSNLLTELMGVQRAGDSLDSSYRLAFWDANQVNVAECWGGLCEHLLPKSQAILKQEHREDFQLL